MDATRVRGPRKSCGGRPAVAGVDLDVDTGEVLAPGVDPATAPRAWRSAIVVVQQSATDLGEATATEAVRHSTRYYPDPDEVAEFVGPTPQRRVRGGHLHVVPPGRGRGDGPHAPCPVAFRWRSERDRPGPAAGET
ncbi:hypothetical protein AB0I60_24915 [Actinosynnema sp. NPDC050436]|uniref:hypothetical protein n=1 Tax=Actinosynnema sp. NPDC050436 TaxID=3155659 RepID=UPI00340DE2CE